MITFFLTLRTIPTRLFFTFVVWLFPWALTIHVSLVLQPSMKMTVDQSKRRPFIVPVFITKPISMSLLIRKYISHSITLNFDGREKENLRSSKIVLKVRNKITNCRSRWSKFLFGISALHGFVAQNFSTLTCLILLKWFSFWNLRDLFQIKKW